MNNKLGVFIYHNTLSYNPDFIKKKNVTILTILTN